MYCAGTIAALGVAAGRALRESPTDVARKPTTPMSIVSGLATQRKSPERIIPLLDRSIPGFATFGACLQRRQSSSDNRSGC